MNSDAEGRLMITYFTIKILDEIIRNRQKKFETRMQAITYMRYVYENRNYVTKKRLHYRMFPDMMFFIKDRLNNIISINSV